MHSIEERFVEIANTNPDALLAEGFDEAIIGLVQLDKDLSPIVLYSYKTCVEILMADEGMTDDEAIDWMDYNVVGSYLGFGTPAFLPMFFEDELFYVIRADGEHRPIAVRLFDEEE